MGRCVNCRIRGVYDSGLCRPCYVMFVHVSETTRSALAHHDFFVDLWRAYLMSYLHILRWMRLKR